MDGINEVLANFGSFGMALGVVLGIGWQVWKKIIEPQQKMVREEQRKHIETLNKINEDHGATTKKHLEVEGEQTKALQELNNKMFIHNENSRLLHEKTQDAIKSLKK